MAERRQLRSKINGGGNYFAAPKTGIEFIRTGSKLLDLAMGGGWAENRIGNVVGDKSTGKTLLMIEGCANFAMKYPKGRIRYREAEAAFDPPYAKAIGMPTDRVDFGAPMDTVEDLFEDLQKVIAGARQPELYVLDSLDALSDRAEMQRDMDEGTYGANKAKNLSQMFRRTVRALERSKVTCLIVSQVRSRIGVMGPGRQTTRSGGRALDFYATHVLYLSHLGRLVRTSSGVKRPVGVKIKAFVDKNKIALPFREAQFDIRFGYGIDDATACLSWLKEVRALKQLGIPDKEIKAAGYDLIDAGETPGAGDDMVTMANIHELVERRWFEIEKSFLPARGKYS